MSAGVETAIRPLEASDWAAWTRLWTGYLTFYETELPEAMHRRAFERMLSGDAGEFRGLVATQGAEPIGLVHYLFHRHGWREEAVIYLQDLYVDPSVRGGGVGARLIEAVYDAGDRAGCPYVYWTTQDFNAPARALYDRVGEWTPFIRYQRPSR